MDNFDPKRLSKLTYPPGINETEYLWFVGNGKWMASNKDQTCTSSNHHPANAIAVLNAKFHPVNSADRDAMIVSLEEEIEMCQKFLDEYGSWPAWKSSTEVKDARKGIKRIKLEISRLKGLTFPG